MIAVLLCIAAAGAYGTSDFAAGLATRQASVAVVTGTVEAATLLTATAALPIFHGAGPSTSALAWGALSGLGAALGTLSLYRGMSLAPIGVVAVLSAVLTAVVPAIVGVALGDRLNLISQVGIVIAVPAIGLISWQSDGDSSAPMRAGLLYGSLAGVGFALLLIALDRAGTHAGAWPLIPCELVALLVVAPLVHRDLSGPGPTRRPPVALMVGAGALGGIADLLFLVATSRGALAIIAVVTSFYPAATILLARALLSERWTRRQAVGLLASLAAVILVSAS